MEKICIIWDLDGTIIDSVDLYYEAYRGVFQKYSLGRFDTTKEEYREKYFGSSVEYFLNCHLPEPVSAARMNEMKWDYLHFANDYLRNSADGGIRLLSGVEWVISAFHEKGYPMAIASTSWMPTVVCALEKVGLLDKFDNIASGNLLPSKPAPDVFLLAAALNRMPTDRCVVFEDSLNGMRGAKAAGMKCVGIATSVMTGMMADADIRLNSYDELLIEDVEALFPN